MTATMTSTDILEHARSLDPNLALAVQAASLAGAIIAGGYDQVHQIDAKGVGDLVSDIDREADQAMTGFLSENGDTTIISEELNPSIENVPDECWIVDPLDASSAFLMRAGKQYPSVLVARRSAGRTIGGVVYFPLTDEWFYAQANLGAWHAGDHLRVPADSVSLAESWVEMNQYGDASLETETFANLRQRLRSTDGACLVTSNVPHAGVAMRICQANSSLAAVVHDNQVASIKQGPWDIAAPQLIVQEAGGTVLGLDGQAVDPFAGKPFVIARSESLAQEILALQ